MRPLTTDDLLPLREYADGRDEFVEAHRRYCQQYRRVRLGPDLLLQFENRQTLWFRLQEMLHIMQLCNPNWIDDELRRFNQLLPASGGLAGGIVPVEPLPESQIASLQTGTLRLRMGATIVPALVEATPGWEYLCWLRFALTEEHRHQLASDERPAWIELENGPNIIASDALAEEVRQSLLDDLASPSN